MRTEDVSQFELLCHRHPGVTLKGFVEEVSGVTPEQAWAHIARMDSKPSLKFSDTQWAEALDSWWRLARAYRLLSNAGACLISVGGLGQLPWARMRLPEHSPILDIFARDAGSPEFIARNKAGSFLLGVTAEEDEIWLYLVEHQGHQFRTVAATAGEFP